MKKKKTTPSEITPSLSFISQIKTEISMKYNTRMQITTKNLLVTLFFLLSSLSLLRLLRLTTFTSSSSSSSSSSSPLFPTLTDKELHLLTKIISLKRPCNLLIFGLTPQYIHLASLNKGTTLFLEDNPETISTLKSSTTRVYKVSPYAYCKEAYRLLELARRDAKCAPGGNFGCELTLRGLPEEVYQVKWDVIVVDGPKGDGSDAPGRMEVIYTVGMMARESGGVDVVVHDVDRTIEKWFSWEFLCDENLVSSKGKFWHFRVQGGLNSTSFCSTSAVKIV